ncbi:MAG: CRISPR-associated endonuclease Cas2 [Sulfurospirillum sp.]|nr:CRISPR-associated endonuclease Cas2 [Sulfurospirillum sp.]
MQRYIIAYDICDPKRLYKVAKILYANALGGQKSVLEIPLSKKDIEPILKDILQITKEIDKINVIPVEDHPILLGKAKSIDYEKGVIII